MTTNTWYIDDIDEARGENAPQYINLNKRRMMSNLLKRVNGEKISKVNKPDEDWKRVDNIFRVGQPIYSKLAKILTGSSWSKNKNASYEMIVRAKENFVNGESIVIRSDFYDKRMDAISSIPKSSLKEQVLLTLNAFYKNENSDTKTLLNGAGGIYIPELLFEEIYEIADYFKDTTTNKYDNRLTYTRDKQTIWTPKGEKPHEITYMELNVLKQIIQEEFGEIKDFERIGVYLRDQIREYCDLFSNRKKAKLASGEIKQDIIETFALNYEIKDKIAYPKPDISTIKITENYRIPLPINEPILEKIPDRITIRLMPATGSFNTVHLAL